MVAEDEGSDRSVSKLKRPRGKALRGRELSKVLARGANQSLSQYVEQSIALGNDPRVKGPKDETA
jgi:hypothetical protein